MILFRRNLFTLITLICFIVVMGAPLGYAQQTVKMGYIDLEKINNKWAKYKTAAEEVKKFIAEKRKDLYEKNQELMKEYETFRVRKELIPAEDAKKQLMELTQSQDALKEQQATDGKAVDDKRRELLEPLMKELESTVEKVAIDGKYTFVFERRTLFYCDPSFEITDKVLAILNK